MTMRRQGDVFITQVSETKENLAQVKEQILAYGEVTGHKHVLRPDSVDTLIKSAFKDGVRTVEVSGGTATIVHEEHAPITLPPGLFEIKIQQEYDPNQYRRNVQD